MAKNESRRRAWTRARARAFASREAARLRLAGIKNTRRHERTCMERFFIVHASYDDDDDDDALSIDRLRGCWFSL